MVTRAFAIEDGNLNQRSLVTARTRLYKDIDLLFITKPSGDVYKKTDAAAVKQSVKTILMTNYGEKPFRPDFGANLQSMLFELADDELATTIDIAVRQAIATYEPRARVLNVVANSQPDRNLVSVTTEFQILSTEEVVVVQTTLSRLR